MPKKVLRGSIEINGKDAGRLGPTGLIQDVVPERLSVNKEERWSKKEVVRGGG